MNVIRLALVLCLACGCSVARSAITPWIDFQIVEGFVVIPTEVQGIKGHSIIDTGSTVTGIMEHFVENNDLKLVRAKGTRITGVNGAETRKVYQNLKATLLGAELVFQRVVEIDLSSRPQLLIGADFLSTLYFQFDYPNRRLRAISRDTFDLKKLSNVESRLDKGFSQPIAKVRMNDEHDAWLTIDTGNAGGVFIKRDPAKKQKWLERYPVEVGTSRGAVTTGKMESFRLPVISLGPFNVRNARVTVPAEGEKSAMFPNTTRTPGRRKKSQGLLGYDMLKNFVVTFDYKTGSMFIELPEEIAQQ